MSIGGMRRNHRFAAWQVGVRNALLAGILATVSAAHAESIKQVVESTLKTNPRVLTADAQRRAAVQDVAQARARYYPSVDLNLLGGRENTDTPQTRALNAGDGVTMTRQENGIIVSQMLFDGMAVKNEVERLNARLDVAAKRLAEVREEIALRTVEVYLDVLRARRLVRLAEENLGAHQTTEKKIGQRVTGGVSQRSDLQQALGRTALSRSALSARTGALREAEANFQAVVGRPAPALEDPVPPTDPTIKSVPVNRATLAQAVSQASTAAGETSPTLGAANAEISAAEAALRGARAPYYPRLNLELSANRNRNIGGIRGEHDSEAAMLVMRWNLFRGGGDRAQERALAERRYAAIDNAASTRRDVEERVALALNAKATTEERLGYLQEHARLSVEVLDSYQQQLDLGRRTLLDVLNAENELFSSRSNYAAARYDDIFNRYLIEAAKGTLVKSLGVTVTD